MEFTAKAKWEQTLLSIITPSIHIPGQDNYFVCLINHSNLISCLMHEIIHYRLKQVESKYMSSMCRISSEKSSLKFRHGFNFVVFIHPRKITKLNPQRKFMILQYVAYIISYMSIMNNFPWPWLWPEKSRNSFFWLCCRQRHIILHVKHIFFSEITPK